MTLADLVRRAAERAPDDLALVGVGGPEDRWTWQQLDDAAGRLAGVLRRCGVGIGDRVAVAQLKTAHSYVAAHAIVRSGAALVPIDPLASAPVAREVIRDAEVACVIGDSRTLAKIQPWTLSPAVDSIVSDTSDGEFPRASSWPKPDDPPIDPVAIGLDDDAYIIYTSGSTGIPKGIVHTHRSALAYVEIAAREHGLRQDDRIAGMCPLHFDMSTLELWVGPFVGAPVIAMSEADLRFPASFTTRCAAEGVTVWYTVPFLLRNVVERGGIDRLDLTQVRLVMYGGEPYHPAALRELMDALPGATIVNVYGPAEVNACTTHVVTRPDEGDVDVPIGGPWASVEVQVVDGELWVSSPTIMRGYWRRPELTESKLHPRSGGPPWYATGDVVERDAAGLLHYRGRVDSQVKIRGTRVELDAVESIVAAAPGVAQAVVGTSVGADGTTRVVAAVTGPDSIDIDAVSSWCFGRLPPAAIPEHVVEYESFPVAATGKIDRARIRTELSIGPSEGFVAD